MKQRVINSLTILGIGLTILGIGQTSNYFPALIFSWIAFVIYFIVAIIEFLKR